MNLKKAASIVLILAESKWLFRAWRFHKLTEEQKKAISYLSQYIEHGKWPEDILERL